MKGRIIKLLIVLIMASIVILLLTNKNIFSQSPDTGNGVEINVETVANIS